MMDLTVSHAASFFNPTTELDPLDLIAIRADLTQQLAQCQMRGLHQTCKWLGDLHVALGGAIDAADLGNTWSEVAPHFGQYCLAKSYLDTKEYERCAHVLSEVAKNSPLLYFIQMYAKYLAAEKKWLEDEMDEMSCDKKVQRSEVVWIKRELESHQRKVSLDAYGLYLYGIVLAKLGLSSQAVDALCQSVNLDSSLWCSWYELSRLVQSREQVTKLRVPACWMKFFFEARVYLALHERERALDLFSKLAASGFADSINLQTDLAVTHEAMRDMATAAKQFKQVCEADPYRLDGMDVYSNVLFVSEIQEELAFLTHRCVRVDKYRPETCCIVGNFYSLRNQHDKAVLYFQRALKLKPAYSLVWTLVGHEYMELRNINAAVHAYRQAIEHNKRDYRAWYGLGQMYELLLMPSYTIYYYREALCLQPCDSRPAVALGETYERLGRLEEAKKCFWRAYAVGDLEGNALIRLAKCYEQCEEGDEAATAYAEYIKHCERKGIHNNEDFAHAYKYLASYHLREGHYDDASLAAHKCLDFAETKEEGKAMVKQINSLRSANLEFGTQKKAEAPTTTSGAAGQTGTGDDTDMEHPNLCSSHKRGAATLSNIMAPSSSDRNFSGSDRTINDTL